MDLWFYIYHNQLSFHLLDWCENQFYYSVFSQPPNRIYSITVYFFQYLQIACDYTNYFYFKFFFFFSSELLLKLELNLSVCLSYVETQTESKLRQNSTVSWFLKSSKLLSWHRKNHTVTSLQHLDQGSTLFEQLRSIVASVHFTSV